MQKNYWIIFIFLVGSFIGCTQEQMDSLLYTNGQRATDDARKDSLVLEKLCETLTNRLLGDGYAKLMSQNEMTVITDELLKIYTPSNFKQLRWQSVQNQTANPKIFQYIDYLRKAEENGLIAADYQLSDIETLYQKVYPSNPKIDSIQISDKKVQATPPKDLQQMIDLDLLLSQSYLNYASDLLYGSFRPKSRNWEVATRERDLGEVLDKALTDNNIESSLKNLNPASKNFADLQQYLKKCLDIAKSGTWKSLPANASFGKGKSGEQVLQLAQKLAAMGDLPASKANSNNFDDDFVAAIRNYQTRHGLAITGSLDAPTLQGLNTPIEEDIDLLRLNMNRYRWLPDDLGERYVWANIPEFMVYVYDEGKRTTEIVSVVGEFKNMTPILINKPMQNIIFSPTWTIPRSIAKEELEYIKMNPGVLIVADVEVFLKGKKVNPYSVDWEKVDWKDVKLKQDPKDSNSMGRAKFMFTNNHSIYLHDTPNKVDFKTRVRSFSHGCIRLEDPALFAENLLAGSGSWNNQRIRNAMFSEKEQYVNPPKKTRVHVVYFTAWADDEGTLQLRRDIYAHDKRQLKMMNKTEKRS
ncbi:MAG: L,D-transpeptidase family protein [Chitinophagales bacterium]